MTEISIKNIKTFENLNEKALELLSDKGMIAPYLASSLVNLFKPENKSQFILMEDENSSRMNDCLKNGAALYSNMLTSRIGNKSFKLGGDLLETMSNYDFNVNHSNQPFNSNN